ncbi:DEAD/DEAH box helicase [Hydrogenophaga sp. NFH-34]|uniref:DEAD/DEAH box helicase n=1 Tax=Hydrogenophaga sp. NFH-34 TaxID=2744446 RepID=UPI001F25C007|nr:DEAD/DEAH box helicase [Hydrogenophaga sp. NFH-34]
MDYFGPMDAQVAQRADLRPIGCEQPWEALLCLPKIHIDKRGAYTSLHRAPQGRPCLIQAKIINAVGFDSEDRVTKSPYPAYVQVELRIDDEYVKTRFYRASTSEILEMADEKVILDATIEHRGRFWAIKSPSISAVTGRVEPVYTGVSGQLAGDIIRSAVSQAIEDDLWHDAVKAIEQIPAVMEVLSAARRTPMWLLQGLHQPKSLMQADEALGLARVATVAEVKAHAKPTRCPLPSPYSIDDALIELVQAQSETLSQSQRKALNRIRLACNAARPAHILLNGDVGSGKTLVFLLALAAIANASRGRVAVMAPSDLVARQIHEQATLRFPHLAPCLVSGDPKSDATEEQLQSAQMFVGTQALLSRRLPTFEALVVDEQHKLSVDQRTALLASHTHIIEASATPIPRTLALALFDGWTNAVIEAGHVNKTIINHVLVGDEREVAALLVRKHLQAGRKVIFLYPTVNGKETGVKSKGEALAARFEGKVAVLHGKLKPQEKVEALDSFRTGEKPIIVSSTAIEVGVDVPDVGLMVVTGADRFGVAQLHQLRGRLVRNGGEGDFAMLTSKTISKTTRRRLEAVAQTNDGFALAQKDLELRGFGELLGEAQVGDATTLFKLARLGAADFIST